LQRITVAGVHYHSVARIHKCNSTKTLNLHYSTFEFYQHKYRLDTYRKGSYPHFCIFFAFSKCATHDNSWETDSRRNRLQTTNVKRPHKPISLSGRQHRETKRDAKRCI